jgi:hypothetical protein
MVSSTFRPLWSQYQSTRTTENKNPCHYLEVDSDQSARQPVTILTQLSWICRDYKLSVVLHSSTFLRTIPFGMGRPSGSEFYSRHWCAFYFESPRPVHTSTGSHPTFCPTVNLPHGRRGRLTWNATPSIVSEAIAPFSHKHLQHGSQLRTEINLHT